MRELRIESRLVGAGRGPAGGGEGAGREGGKLESTSERIISIYLSIVSFKFSFRWRVSKLMN
jgi:hypothetical protein